MVDAKDDAARELDDAPDWSVVVLAPLLVGLCLWSLPQTIQAGDAGEFATVMLRGGVPHPPGYPWMRALGLLARGLWQLGMPPATAAALIPGLCGIGAWLVLHRCCARLGSRWIAATVIAVAAASPLVVTHVNDSEVWGPHLLLSSLFLYLALRCRAHPRPLVLGLALGLALSQHLTAALLVPVAIAAALPRWPADRSAEDNQARRLLHTIVHGLLGVLGTLLGLLPFASLAIGTGGRWRWGAVRSLDGLVAHVLRRDYGTFSLSLHDEQVAAGETIARALASVGEVFSAGLVVHPAFGVATLVAALGLGGAWARAHRDRVRVGVAIGWALALVASALVFPAAHNIDPSGPFGAWILERFDLLTVALTVVPLSLGLAWLGERLGEAVDARAWLVPAGGAAIGLVTCLAQLGAVLDQGRPQLARGVERAAVDLVRSPAPSPQTLADSPVRAIVIGTDDHRSFPVLYVQAVRGVAPQTLYIDAQLLAHPWYRAQLRARLPSLPDVDKPMRLINAIEATPALADLPIYLANVFSAPAARRPKVPEGLLWRVVPHPQSPRFDPAAWTADAILDRHLAAYARMSATPADFAAHRRDPWTADLAYAYADKARELAAALARDGRGDAIPAVAEALSRRTGLEL